MSKKLSEYMSLKDTVEYVMKATGKTRRQAQQAVLQAMKSGAVRVRAEVVVTDTLTGEEENQGVQDIPAGFFRHIPSEH